MPATLTRRSVAVAAVAVALLASGLAAPGAAHSAPTGVVAGTVTGPADGGGTIPVKGIRVDVDSVSATTRADGTYRVAGLAPGDHHVCFYVPAAAQKLTATGFVPHCHGTTAPIPSGNAGTPVTVTAGATTTVNDTLPAAAALHGTVTTSTGTPVAGAVVSYDDGYSGASTTSAADGTFALNGILGTQPQVTVEVRALPVTATEPGPASRYFVPTPVVLGQVTTSTFALPAGGGTKGRVVDAAGAAVPGATVTVSRTGTSSVVVTTRPDGTWVVGHLTAGTYKVCTTPPAGANLLARCTAGVAVVGGAYTSANQTLATAAALIGTVLDRAGRPLADVQVSLADRSLVTGADGSYRFAGLATGPTALHVTPLQDVGGVGSYLATSASVTLKTGSTLLSPRLAYAGTLTGRVVDDTGAPVPGAEVAAIVPTGDDGFFVQNTTSSDDGTYVIHNLPNATYRMTASHPGPTFGSPAGYTANDDGASGSVTGARSFAVTDIRLVRRTGLDVRVTGPGGGPVVGSDVRVTPGGGQYPTDRDGRWTITLPDAGSYQVCALAVAPSATYPNGLAQKCRTVALRTGAVSTVTLQLSPPAAT